MTRREYLMIYSLMAFICVLLLLALWLMHTGVM
jgi:hypothetical protein